MSNDGFTVLVSGGGRHPWMSMRIVWPLPSKWLSEYSNESVPGFVLSLDITQWKLLGWFRSNWWLSSFITTTAHSASCVVQSFWWNIKSSRWCFTPCSPVWVPCNFWLFQKLKSPLKGKNFQIVNEIQENTKRQLMAIGRTVWGPQVPALKRTEASLSWEQCFLYLLSSSINVSIFYIMWLDTFWTGVIYLNEIVCKQVDITIYTKEVFTIKIHILTWKVPVLHKNCFLSLSY